MGEKAWPTIEVSREGAITILRLHSDGAALTWTAQSHQDLSEVWSWVAGDAQTKVVVLTGTGTEFCTTIVSPSGQKEWHDIWLEGKRMIAGMVGLDVPIIAVVNGPAEIHSEVPLLADIVLAVPEASFADRAHVVRGVVPGDGIYEIWSDLIGPSRASYHLLTGTSVSSEDALRLGMVHEVHAAEAVLERALAIARPLAEISREALAYSCAVMRSSRRDAYGTAVSRGLAYAGLALQVAARRAADNGQ